MNLTHRNLSLITAIALSISTNSLATDTQFCSKDACKNIQKTTTCTNNKLVCTKVIFQEDIPFNAKKPGNYCLGQNVFFSANKHKAKAAITISSKNVVFDGNDHVIDLKGHAGSGIRINGNKASAVEIRNVTIQNSGAPGAVQPTIPDTQPDTSAATTPLEGYNLFLAGTQATGIQNPLPTNDALDASGIGLRGAASAVTIENCKFLNVFVGIAAEQPVKDIIINNCQAYNGGFNFGPSFGFDPLRGGFIIFGNLNTTPDAIVKSENIQISNCIGDSLAWQFGIGLFSARNSSITNCKMRAATDTGAASSGIDCYGLFFCDNCIEDNNESWGGTTGFGHFFSSNGVIQNCNGFLYTDHGTDNDLTKFYKVDNCKFSNLLFNTEPIPGLINKGWGISGGFSLNLTVTNCQTTNNVKPPLAGDEGVGILMLSSNSVIKNNISNGNNFGVLAIGCQNCIFENNICNGNKFIGFLDNSFGLIPSVGNQYYRNEAANNPGGNFVGTAIKCVVSAATCPLVGRLENIQP